MHCAQAGELAKLASVSGAERAAKKLKAAAEFMDDVATCVCKELLSASAELCCRV